MYSIEQMTRIYRIASQRSFWRGFDYARNNYVTIIKHNQDGSIDCEVQGRRDEPYHVHFDNNKMKKSTCDCPMCREKPSYFCKHKVASYFTIHKEEFENAKNFYDQIEKENQAMRDEYYSELKLEEDKIKERVEKELANLSKEELKERLAKELIHDYMESVEKDLFHEYEDYLDFEYEE